MAIHSSILAWKIPRTEEPGGVTVHGVSKESDMTGHIACMHTQFCLFHLSQHLPRNFSAYGPSTPKKPLFPYLLLLIRMCSSMVYILEVFIITLHQSHSLTFSLEQFCAKPQRVWLSGSSGFLPDYACLSPPGSASSPVSSPQRWARAPSPWNPPYFPPSLLIFFPPLPSSVRKK